MSSTSDGSNVSGVSVSCSKIDAESSISIDSCVLSDCSNRFSETEISSTGEDISSCNSIFNTGDSVSCSGCSSSVAVLFIILSTRVVFAGLKSAAALAACLASEAALLASNIASTAFEARGRTLLFSFFETVIIEVVTTFSRYAAKTSSLVTEFKTTFACS